MSSKIARLATALVVLLGLAVTGTAGPDKIAFPANMKGSVEVK